MLKSVIIASLMLISQVFGNEGFSCSEKDITDNIKMCNNKDPTKLLKCEIDKDRNHGVWKFDSKCVYCCTIMFPVVGSFCTDSEADCEKQENIFSQDSDFTKISKTVEKIRGKTYREFKKI